MHIELIGCTSAGKTTLAKKIVNKGRENGMDIWMSDDFILHNLGLNWVKNDFLRRRLIEIFAFIVCLGFLRRYWDFYLFSFREGVNIPGPWIYKINRVRNVIRKIGIYHLIRFFCKENQYVLADNEGVLQGAHNLFVHNGYQSDLERVQMFGFLIPLPDVVVYYQREQKLLVERILTRGHSRISEGMPDKVNDFVKQANLVFDTITSIPTLQSKLLIIEPNDTIGNSPGIDENPIIGKTRQIIKFGLI